MFLRVIALVCIAASAAAQSPLDQILGRTGTTKSSSAASNLPTDKITAGLKEALKVSTNKAVAQTGRPDGFLKNEAIKILLPPKLQTAGRGLRMVGMGPQLDELEVGMNRAAEQAAPQAKQIFLNALLSMNIDDARRILSGGDTAATDFFRNKSTADLTSAFRPIVHQAMMNVGVVKQYSQITRSPMAAALAGKFDLDGYVVGKTLDGIFYVLGQEERKIRTNPAAQTTTLLKEVFGGRR